MRLSREEVTHIATLCRIGMTDEDLERFAEQLSQILEQFEVLDRVDTSDIPPTAQTFDMHSVFRDDAPGEALPQDDALLNAPRREEQYFRVQAILEE